MRIRLTQTENGIPDGFAPVRGAYSSEAYPAQLIIIEPGGITVHDGKAIPQPDGSLVVEMPLNTAPPAGTPVQIIIYGPDEPTVIDGTTTATGPDGSIGVVTTPAEPTATMPPVAMPNPAQGPSPFSPTMPA